MERSCRMEMNGIVGYAAVLGMRQLSDGVKTTTRPRASRKNELACRIKILASEYLMLKMAMEEMIAG